MDLSQNSYLGPHGLCLQTFEAWLHSVYQKVTARYDQSISCLYPGSRLRGFPENSYLGHCVYLLNVSELFCYRFFIKAPVHEFSPYLGSCYRDFQENVYVAHFTPLLQF